MEISMARERKKGKGFLIAFIVMFILVAVGIAVYIGFQAESITSLMYYFISCLVIKKRQYHLYRSMMWKYNGQRKCI